MSFVVSFSSYAQVAEKGVLDLRGVDFDRPTLLILDLSMRVISKRLHESNESMFFIN
jgi:hypothetical protein